jgi:hypothetical protein
MTAGYSGTPLVKKLGIKPGFVMAFVHLPPDYVLLPDLPEGITIATLALGGLDWVQAFYTERAALETEFPALKAALRKDGTLWISWVKKAAKIPTDLDENMVRHIGLRNGLVDVKVAAIDEQWSGLKFVYRVEDR